MGKAAASWRQRETQYCLATDIGSSKAAAAVIDEEGDAKWTGAIELPRSLVTKDGWLIQKPSEWLATMAALVKEAGKHVSLASVKVFGVTATTPTLVGLDERGQLVDDLAVMWNDLNRRGPAHTSGAGVGLQKLVALAEREPKLIERMKYILDQGNFVAYYLTGLVSVNTATLAQKFDWNQRTGYDISGFESLGMDGLLDKLPRRILETGEVLGRLKPGPSAKLGLRANIPVVVAGYDSIAALVGGGLLEPSDDMLMTVGTSIGFYMVPEQQQVDRSGPWVWRDHLLPYGLQTIAGGLEAGMQTIGLVHKKLRLSCSAAERDRNLENLVAKAEGSEPPITFALPFGNAPLKAPFPNRVLPTAIFDGKTKVPGGLTTLVALRRGVAYYARYAITDLRARGIQVSRIHLVGGGTKSPSFCQLVASACGLPVLDFGHHAAAIGAAILAVTATSSRARRAELVRRLHKKRTTYHPDPTLADVYDSGYGHFVRHLHAALGLRASPQYAEVD